MSATLTSSRTTSARPATAGPGPLGPVGDELLSLGREINTNQHRLVHLAARFDDELEWYRQGLKSASHWIAAQLQIHSSTAREWIRVGHALRSLPLIDVALSTGELSYAKARILTRWANEENEQRLLDLASGRSADRLSVAIARALAEDGESDDERDRRLHEERSVTTWTDGDGMTVLRVRLAPSVAKPIVAAIDELVRRIAATPPDSSDDVHDRTARCEPCAPAGAFGRPCVVGKSTQSDEDPPAGASGGPSVTELSPGVTDVAAPEELDPLGVTLRELRRRWQPSDGEDWFIPSLAQQRADAFVALFMGLGIDLTTEVVFHVRGDGATFDDGTPVAENAIFRLLDRAFIRLLIHDAERRPINASGRQRLPTTRQQRVVMERHSHECTQCQTTDLLVLHHEPPFEQTQRTVIDELEPRCAPCHRARHRNDR